MQQRFCDCGCSILIAYVITRKGVWHLYRINSKLVTHMRCPSCGRALDINELR